MPSMPGSVAIGMAPLRSCWCGWITFSGVIVHIASPTSITSLSISLLWMSRWVLPLRITPQGFSPQKPLEGAGGPQFHSPNSSVACVGEPKVLRKHVL